MEFGVDVLSLLATSGVHSGHDRRQRIALSRTTLSTAAFYQPVVIDSELLTRNGDGLKVYLRFKRRKGAD